MQRILCVNPEHQESNPSMVVYSEYAHCFSCGFRVPVSSLGPEFKVQARRQEPENLAEALEYIRSLPLTKVRGLDLPADSEGYYLVWSDGSYFKKRRWIADNAGKYKCPRGHAKPLYTPWAPRGAKMLALVEGEINALSLASLRPSYAVCSPGGVGDFSEKILDKNASLFLEYTRYRLILDKDQVGLEAAMRMKRLLLKRTPYVEVKLMDRDLNELLQSGELNAEDWA